MNILIADDSEDSRIILRKTLEHAGHTVLDTPNGAEALRIARDSGPEMVISDILMPEMDGFNLCKEFKTDDRLRKIPFIFYTATYTNPKDEKLAYALGASRFIIKPADNEEFLSTIDNVIREYKEEQPYVPHAPLAGETELRKMQDESVERKLDKKIRELELFRDIFTNSKDAIAIINGQGYYLDQNYAHESLTGYSYSELAGTTPAIFLGDEIFSFILGEIREQGYYRGELLGYRKSGKALNIDISAFHASIKTPDTNYYALIIRDISERKQKDEELKEHRAHLEELVDQRTAELKKIVNAMSGREVRMSELKKIISRLIEQIEEAGLTPVVKDPLDSGQ